MKRNSLSTKWRQLSDNWTYRLTYIKI